jgi:uncharacterized membrane protein YphA (DoxX/SURF4 family)
MNPLYPAILITLMFFLSGIEKIYTFSKTTADFASKINVPIALAKLIIIGVILLEIIAPMIIVGGYPPLAKQAILSLIVFTIAATVMYHTKHRQQFLTHVALVGGLLALYEIKK